MRETRPDDLPRTVAKTLPRTALIGLRQLLDAKEFAVQTCSDVWDFAVELTELTGLGVSLAELRLLAQIGYVDHGIEISSPDDGSRQFAEKAGLVFGQRTCFVLTRVGENATRRLCAEVPSIQSSIQSRKPAALAPGNGRNSTPVWNSQLRELRIGGALVKEFRWQAMNQEMVLTAFQEEGWPAVILDPLPPRAEQDPKRRLHDTIKCLNRNQVNDLMRFHGDGTGEGVIWKTSTEISVAMA